MYTVGVRLTPSHLAALMRDMRSWLDLHGISVSEFSYTEGINKLITRLIFGAEQVSEGFFDRFCGVGELSKSSVDLYLK